MVWPPCMKRGGTMAPPLLTTATFERSELKVEAISTGSIY